MTIKTQKLIFATVLGLTPAVCVAQANAKGVFVDGGGSANATAVKYNVLLERDGEWQSIPANRRFQSGDRFKLQVALNREGYVYILHRTMEGDPDELVSSTRSKGVLCCDDDGHRRPSFTLMFPTEAAGLSNKFPAKKTVNVPMNGPFRMDEKPGLEKFVVIVSSRPLDTRDLPVANNRGARNDTDESVSSQLSKDLDAYSANAITTVDEKGVEVDNYAAPRDSKKPVLVNIDLRHYTRR